MLPRICREEKCIIKISSGRPRGKSNYKELGIDGKIIVKENFGK
jgi:hypothetical protein